MKVTKEKLQKIIQEELQQMQQEGEVDEALGTFLKSLGTGVGDVARSAASGVSGAISAAKEASKKADEEAAKAKEETRKAAERVKTSSDVEIVLRSALKQVTGTLDSLNALTQKMKELGMPVAEAGLDLPLVLQQLKTARSALFHGGKKSTPLKTGQGVSGFDPTQGIAQRIRGARQARQEQEEE